MLSLSSFVNPIGAAVNGAVKLGQALVGQEASDATEAGASAATTLAVSSSGKACSVPSVANANPKLPLTIPHGNTLVYFCEKKLEEKNLWCSYWTCKMYQWNIKQNTKMYISRTSKTMRGKKGSAKYECYKQNIITAHNNVFGVWKQKVVNAKEKLEFAESLKDLDAAKVGTFCSAFDSQSTRSQPAARTARLKRKNFISAFCKNGKIKKSLMNPNRLLAMKKRFLRLAKRAHKKAKSKFKVEFEAYRAQTLWFSRVYISRLKSEAKVKHQMRLEPLKMDPAQWRYEVIRGKVERSMLD